MSVASNDNPCRRKFLTDCGRGLIMASGIAWIESMQSALAEEPRTADQKPPTALVMDPVFAKHVTGAGHPEAPDRYKAVAAALAKAEFAQQLKRLTVRLATQDEIARCHDRRYIETAKKDIESGARQLTTGDTPVCPDSLKVALAAAGSVCGAVDQVIAKKAKNAFCVVRPPGHHATPSRGMGFCIFNNVAIAARYAQERHKIGKVLIVDWDVHHGNGTQDIFYDDPSVLFFSTHQSPWYPWTGSREETGTGKGRGTTLNRPFPAGAGRKEIVGAFQDDLLPVVNRFKPELVLISAGFDSRRGDPLGRFVLTDEDFVELTRIVLEIAREHAEGRVVSVLEGGYKLSGLASAAKAHCERLHVG